MFTISLGRLINDISHCWCIKKRRINSSRERALIFFRSNSLEKCIVDREKRVSPWRSTLLCWRRPERLVALIKNPPPISLVPKSPNAITHGLGNISVIKIPPSLSHFPSLSLFLSLSLPRESRYVLQPTPPLTLASKRFLFVLQTKGFSRGSERRRGKRRPAKVGDEDENTRR